MIVNLKVTLATCVSSCCSSSSFDSAGQRLTMHSRWFSTVSESENDDDAFFLPIAS